MREGHSGILHNVYYCSVGMPRDLLARTGSLSPGRSHVDKTTLRRVEPAFLSGRPT